MRKIALMLTFSLALFSCEKDKQVTNENSGVPLISKVIVSGQSYYEYSYSDANLISEEKSKLHYTRHNYNGRNQLISSEFYLDPAMFSSSSYVVESAYNRKEWANPDNTPKSLTKAFEYNDIDQLIRITYIRPSLNNPEYSEFTYENDKISRQMLYWQNVMSYYTDYVYDEKGNLTKESKYRVSSSGLTELWTTTEYEFDNMQNPYLSFKRLVTPGIYTNQNNITKERYTIHFEVDKFTQKVQITNTSYEYNHRGYPVKVNGEAEYVYK